MNEGPSTTPPGVGALIRTSLDRDRVHGAASEYVALHRDTADARRVQYADLVNRYYDLATDFFEYGWGTSFHFAPRLRDETLRESILRHEYVLALRLGLAPGMQVLDVGCGVGGPMRNIARFSGCAITGINNNAYQVARAETMNQETGLGRQCQVMHGDFMAIPLPAATVDAAYSLEATVHAPSWTGVFREIRRVLKPGARFALYDWCMTEAFDPHDPYHQAVKRGIELGNGLPNLGTIRQFLDALEESGFEVLDHHDVAVSGDIPWYEPLAPSSPSIKGFRSTGLGRELTRGIVQLLEWVRIAPKGSAAVAAFLNHGAAQLVEGGRSGIFTPMYFAVCRNPG